MVASVRGASADGLPGTRTGTQRTEWGEGRKNHCQRDRASGVAKESDGARQLIEDCDCQSKEKSRVMGQDLKPRYT